MAAASETQWYAYMKEAYRILKPGGWIQCVEFNPWWKCDDDSVPNGAPMMVYNGIRLSHNCLIHLDTVANYLQEMRKDHFLHGEHLENTLTKGCFKDISIKKFQLRNTDLINGLKYRRID